jgi:hypothetical protein
MGYIKLISYREITTEKKEKETFLHLLAIIRSGLTKATDMH